MKKTYLFIVLGCLIISPVYAQQSALTVDQLLENVEQGKINDNSGKVRGAGLRQRQQ